MVRQIQLQPEAKKEHLNKFSSGVYNENTDITKIEQVFKFYFFKDTKNIIISTSG